LPVTPGTAAAAGVTITTVEVDGDPRPLPASPPSAAKQSPRGIKRRFFRCPLATRIAILATSVGQRSSVALRSIVL
jgi:hypothetical protein